jgi:hypothetical protein
MITIISSFYIDQEKSAVGRSCVTSYRPRSWAGVGTAGRETASEVPLAPPFAAPRAPAQPLISEAHEEPPFAAPAKPSPRLLLTKAVVAAAFLAGLLLSRKLWLTSRSFPHAPVAEWLPAVRPPFDFVVYGLLIALLLAIAVLPRPRWFIVAFVALAAGWMLWDQSRWQPWVYQYLFMLAALALYPWKAGRDVRAEERALNACRVIVAFTYLYSGLQKLNNNFFADTAVWLLEPIVRAVPESVGEVLMSARVVIPFVETTIGAALLINPVRTIGVAMAIAMHLFILASIGPFGHNWNTTVWPWNLAMIALVVILFGRVGWLDPARLLWGPPRAVFPKVVLLLFGVMPLLSFLGRWDLYLSSALYSGNTPRATLEFGGEFYGSLPERVREVCYPWDPPGRQGVALLDWSMSELNVPPYPAERVFRSVGREVARRASTQADREVVLQIDSRPNRNRVRKMTRLGSDELLRARSR